jgi:hypothetical protein
MRLLHAVCLLGLYWYALHNDTVTIDTIRVALCALRLVIGTRGLPRVVLSLIRMDSRCAKRSSHRVLRRATSTLHGVSIVNLFCARVCSVLIVK